MAVNWTQRTFCWLLRTDVVREDDEDEEEEEEEEDPEARLFVDAQHDAKPPGGVAASCQLLRWDGSVSWVIYARDDEMAVQDQGSWFNCALVLFCFIELQT